MRMLNQILLAVLVMTVGFTASAKDKKQKGEAKTLTVSVENAESFKRGVETIELDWKTLQEKIGAVEGKVVVWEQSTSKEVPSQVVHDVNGKPVALIFQTKLKKESTVLFGVKNGTPSKYVSKTFGRFVPERKDDFTWENDRIAHRIYGPALQATGEISAGVDVWSKRTKSLIIDKWYKGEDYHTDHGEGCDFYKVGPSLGAGGVAPVVNGKLYPSKNYSAYKVIDNGPIRTTFVIDYEPWTVEGTTVDVVKTFSIDAGSNLTKCDFAWSFNGKELPVAAGIVRRSNGGQFYADEVNAMIAYWETAPKDHKYLGVGVVFANNEVEVDLTDGHLVGVSKGTNQVFYMGAGWTKSKQFKNFSDWTKYLKAFKRNIEKPLKVTIE
ncbi:DUF4861 domain-containing protein [Puteibacter caeruleilacunae]|nr:DUF4861 domain-containing protein [Puteibacter caeruleilacunae]